MAKLIPLGNNRGNENRPSDEELNQMFGAFMDAFFGGLSDENIDEESDDDIIPFDEFDDSDYWDDLYEGPTPFACSVSSSNTKSERNLARNQQTARFPTMPISRREKIRKAISSRRYTPSSGGE